MSDDPQDTLISRAIKRRKELQDAAKAIMKELEKIEEFLRMYRSLSSPDEEGMQGEETQSPQYILGGAGKGQTQAVFEQLVRTVLLDARRPMRSPEIIQAFRQRGMPIGGNETRTAWNRLWMAKAAGVLTKIPRYGYWLADEPLPKEALAHPPPKHEADPSEKVRRERAPGRKIGRQRLLTDSQVKLLGQWLEEGKKTQAEMARDLGGVSVGTIQNYRLALAKMREGKTLDEALKERHTELTTRRRKPAQEIDGQNQKPSGHSVKKLATRSTKRRITPVQDLFQEKPK